MKYLFIVQAEGRGHLTQTISLAQILERNGHQIVGVLLGGNKHKKIPTFFAQKMPCSIDYFESPTFVLDNENKKIRLFQSIIRCLHPVNAYRYIRSTHFLYRRIRHTDVDVVVNFYEMLGAVCAVLLRSHIPFVSIAHQFMLLHPDYKPRTRLGISGLFLKIHTTLCSMGAHTILALSFYPLPSLFKKQLIVVPPLLRDEVRQLTPTQEDYILGYIVNHGFASEVKKWHAHNPTIPLRFFWDNQQYGKIHQEDVTLSFYAIDDILFLKQLAACRGYVSTAGFESVCEAIYLGKPIMLVPAHIEQVMNACDATTSKYGIKNQNFDLDMFIDYLECDALTNAEKLREFQQWTDKAEYIILHELTQISAHTNQSTDQTTKCNQIARLAGVKG